MEQLLPYLTFVCSGGAAAGLVYVGRFVQRQSSHQALLEAILAQLKELNGSCRTTSQTVAALPCKVEQLDKSCPGVE